MKDLSNFEDSIRTLLADEGQDLTKGFATEIFTHLKQLLVKEGKINLGELGVFLYQEREDSSPKITFMPSLFLRQELNKQDLNANDQERQLTELPVNSIGSIQTDLEQNAAEPAMSGNDEKSIDTVLEKDRQVDVGSKKNKQMDIWNELEETPVAAKEEEKEVEVIVQPLQKMPFLENRPISKTESEVIVQPLQKAPLLPNRPTAGKPESFVARDTIPEQKVPKKPLVYIKAEEEKKFNSKRIWYIVIILLLLMGFGLGFFKCCPSVVGQHTKAKRLMVAGVEVFSIPEGCIACETLKDNETLLGLATKYYGNSCYWVYIFLENKQELKYRGNAIAHTSIRIPQLEGYGVTDPKESVSIKKALALGNELWGNSLK